MSKTLTFWELIKQNKIEIPVIQRDYAQGREEDKVETIRKDFVEDLFQTLKDGTKEALHLGFVYGKIEGKDKLAERDRSKRAIENILNAVEGYAQHLDMRIETDIVSMTNEGDKSINLPIFVPLDGQQRLTTLFLLHWYLNLYVAKDVQELHLDSLSHFSYKTRKSSFEFCDAICNKDNVVSIITSDRFLSDSIQNNKWFRKVWLKDSTVKGMLTMLDEIHLQYQDVIDKEMLFECLTKTQNPRITFDFLDLNELNQTDELYVKMNARGKQLTEFEHFKAWLQIHVKKHKINENLVDSEWSTKIDKDWLDHFWHQKEETFHIDSTVYNAFKQITLAQYIATEEDVKEEATKYLREQSLIPFRFYEKINFFNSNTLNHLFQTLNILSKRELIKKINHWLEDIACSPFIDEKSMLTSFFIRNTKSIERPETVFYFSMLLFFNRTENIEHEIKFKNWMRVTRNLIFNTYIQNPKNFIDAIKSLHELANQVDDIYTYLISDNVEIEFFEKRIVEQEQLKARLISNGEKGWSEAILEYENHTYFVGDISFLFEFCKVDNEFNLERFKFYGDRASILFDEKIRNDKEFIFQKSLLCIDDYLPVAGSNYTVCLPKGNSLRDRRDNWQRFLNDTEKNKILKKLIDDNLADCNFIENELSNLIQSYDHRDWRWYFIKSKSAVIKACEQGFLRFNDEHDIQLLATSKIYGRHAELRSLYWYHNLISKMDVAPFQENVYWHDRMSRYDFSCIRFQKWDFKKQKYKLEITYKNSGEYLIQFLPQESNLEIHNDILECIKNIDGWNIDEYKIHMNLKDENLLKNTISTFLSNLKTLL